ncbi:Uncharacterised protein [Escherichia coli]|nr:Uncharacterised protein [Escherichia coli]
MPFLRSDPSMRSLDSIIKRFIAIHQSFNGIVHFWDADWIASHTTFFTASSVGNTLRFLIVWRSTPFSDSTEFVVYFYAATGLCRDASNGTPDFSTPYATRASLRVIAPGITFPFLPLAARRSRNARPHSVLLAATITGIYNALRSDTCPALLIRLTPLTLLPDS